MKILQNGIAVIENDSHAGLWIQHQNTLLYDGTYNRLVFPMIKPGDAVVDAGAFIGDTTKGFLDAAGQTGRVLAFEPNPEAFACLKHNCPTAEIYNVALGDAEGIGTSYLDAAYKKNYGASCVSKTLRAGVEIKIITLDSLHLEKLNFFKLDVEGFEPFVLDGAKETIARCRPVILTEINQEQLSRQGFVQNDIIGRCEKLGYRMQLLEPSWSLNMIQVDVLFFPS